MADTRRDTAPGTRWREAVFVAALERATAFSRWRAADIRSILAAGAGAGTPHPHPAGEALVIDLPLSPGRPLSDYTPESGAAVAVSEVSG